MVISLFLCTSCDESPEGGAISSSSRIIEGRVGEDIYFIPEGFFIFKGRAFDDDGIYIHIMYPNFSPPEKSTIDIWKQGNEINYIRVLAQHYPKKKANEAELLENFITWEDAYEISGSEFGLLHRTQPDGYVKDKKDIWIEERNGSIRSIFMCSEKLIETDVPQCSQHYHLRDDMQLKVTFDKRLLPNWREIDSGVRALFDSFKARESAQKITILTKSQLTKKEEKR